jgi:hypothetical protein
VWIFAGRESFVEVFTQERQTAKKCSKQMQKFDKKERVWKIVEMSVGMVEK